MKLSNDTTNILKNFSGINTGIFIKKGNVLKTVSGGKNILAQATVGDDFPADFGIYDLNGFLSVLTLNKDPNLEFDGKNILIEGLNGRSKLKYRMTEPSMIVTPPEKEVKFASVDASFTLTQDDYEWVVKTSSVLQSTHVSFKSDGVKVYAYSFNAGDDSAHSNATEFADGNGTTFNIIFKTENLKMLPGSYNIEVSGNVVSFKNATKEIQYWIAAEVGSSIG